VCGPLTPASPVEEQCRATSDDGFDKAGVLLTSLDVIELGGLDVAIQAARNFQTLRALGVTVRKTIGTVIATGCIEDGLDRLLHADRDFEPFVNHLGLRTVNPQS